ncbi:MAG: hypothetical protein H7249_15005 [Chitinophagaceae bacterium]|nr:hypothetical protein [Oligoflexus sp.]
MPFQTFMSESGFKVLAMARLGQCEYSIVLYLLNCAVSGMHDLITTEKELASLIGYSEDELKGAVEGLLGRRMIHVRVHEQSQSRGKQSLRIGMEYNIHLWQLSFDKDVTSHDAVVFPYKREGNVHYLPPREIDQTPTIKHPLPTWKRILNTFMDGRDNLGELELINAERDAMILVDTHPVDQCLIMIRHFGTRIPTLSLLASAWQHYQILYDEETEKVDIQEARHKHLEMDHRLRDAIEILLQQKDELRLSEEEKDVLEVLSNHRHPRRQLFWAYQSRGRYPKLKEFFDTNSFLMLPVTSSGNIFKKKPHLD